MKNEEKLMAIINNYRLKVDLELDLLSHTLDHVNRIKHSHRFNEGK